MTNPARGFLAEILMSLTKFAFRFFIAFLLGTGAGAIVCLYYNIPIVFSVLGGILVLGVALALLSDSSFF
ncbi:MAG: hypothetical protein AB8B64_23430 [Granulosicoccus sp.]